MTSPPQQDLTSYTGVTAQQASARLLQEGYNELAPPPRRNLLTMAVEVLREPMLLLLLASSVVYLILGSPRDALLLVASASVIIGITLYQSHKTEHVLSALRDLSSPLALVLRDGELQRIPGREVVREDILLLREGARIPADAVLLSGNDFHTDESLLTGESVPVRKLPGDEKSPISAPGGDDTPFIYAGSMVVQGQAVARVQRTGLHTEIGRIGAAVQGLALEDSPLQRETRHIVHVFFLIGLVLCAAVVALYVMTRGGWLEGFLAGIVLAMGILPEEFPVVLTVFLALGAWRIAKARVLTRYLPAIETLGAATLLCVDKTGTLTENRMTLSKLMVKGVEFDVSTADRLPRDFHILLEYAALASEREPFDPMERAIQQRATKLLDHTEHPHHDWHLEHEYSLTPELPVMSHVWHALEKAHYQVATKGAPEAIAGLCRLSTAQMQVLTMQTAQLADQGLRVLGVARAEHRAEVLPVTQRDFQFEFLGLIAFYDPLREGVKEAVAECHTAGIRIVMITGDYPRTAQAIARQAGLTHDGVMMSSAELDALSDAALQQKIAAVNIFARITPTQKLRLIQAFKSIGEIVSMTGDGVNDAPALKAAHIGVAMGGRGTDVAREAASLVLLDDDFPSIVRAVRLGRHIHDNLRKAMSYLFAVHVPIAGIALLPLLFGLPLLFAPIHVLFLELIIDPACSIAFDAEPEEHDVMGRPPRAPREPMFRPRAIMLNLLQGLGSLVAVIATYMVALSYALSVETARSLAFSVLIISNIGLIFSNRSLGQNLLHRWRTPNTALWWVVGGALLGLMLVTYIPSLSALFSFAPLNASQLAVAVAAGLSCVLWYETIKNISRPRHMLKSTQLQSLEAGVLYFAVVFGVGFVLGAVRVLWLLPRLGERLAELLEAPIMLIVIILAARWTARRLALPATPGKRLVVGLIALILLLGVEFGVVLWLRGLTLAEYFATRDPLAAMVYYAMLGVFAMMPLLVARR